MRKSVIGLTVFTAIILESAFFPFLAFNGIVPNITLILVICYALHQEEHEAAVTGLLAGLVKDIVLGRIIGVSGITFMLAGYLTGRYNHKIFAEHVTTPVVITLLATLFHESVYLFFIFLLGFQTSLSNARQVFLVQSLFNLLMVVPVYAALRWLFNRRVMKKPY